MRQKFDRNQAFEYMLDNPTHNPKTMSKHLGVSESLVYTMKRELAYNIKTKVSEIITLKRELSAYKVLAADNKKALEDKTKQLNGLREHLEGEFRAKEVLWNDKIKEVRDAQPYKKSDVVTGVIVGALVGASLTAYLFITNGAI